MTSALPFFIDLQSGRHVRSDVLRFEMELQLRRDCTDLRFHFTNFSAIEQHTTVASKIVSTRDRARGMLEQNHLLAGFFFVSWSEYVATASGPRPDTAVLVTMLHDQEDRTIADLHAFDLAGKRPHERVTAKLYDGLWRGTELLRHKEPTFGEVLLFQRLTKKAVGIFRDAMTADEQVTMIPLATDARRHERRNKAN